MKRPLAFYFALSGVLAGALLTGAGCAGDLDPSLKQNTGPTVCDAPTMVFKASCAQPGCHDANTTGGAGLDLASAGVVGRLLGQGPSTNSTAGASCSSAGKPYLMSGSNPATGLLIDKMSQSTVTCGTIMPQIGNVSATQISCLNEWATAVTTGVITQ
jgi:hypothetical protein